MPTKRLGAAAALVGAATLVYFWFLRDWHLHWGATPAEAAGEVAGDELISKPDIVATRAVEIDAPPLAMRSRWHTPTRWEESAPSGTQPSC